MRVCCFRGQGVFKEGRGYGAIHAFVSPTEVLVKFRSGFDTVQIADLLPVAALDQVAKRLEEHEIDLELSVEVKVSRDDELEVDLSDEEPETSEASRGSTWISLTTGSASCGAGIPWASQPETILYSGEPTSKRRPPPCEMASVGFSRIRLFAGSRRSVRRASAWCVSV